MRLDLSYVVFGVFWPNEVSLIILLLFYNSQGIGER